MTKVCFGYTTKDGSKRIGERSFWDPEKARRFLFSLKRSKDKTFLSYSCSDQEEAECLWPF